MVFVDIESLSRKISKEKKTRSKRSFSISTYDGIFWLNIGRNTGAFPPDGDEIEKLVKLSVAPRRERSVWFHIFLHRNNCDASNMTTTTTTTKCRALVLDATARHSLVMISPVAKSLDEYWWCRCGCCCGCCVCDCGSNSGRPNGRLGNASRMVSFPLIVAELRLLDTITAELVSFAWADEWYRIDLLWQCNFFGNEIVWINYAHPLVPATSNAITESNETLSNFRFVSCSNNEKLHHHRTNERANERTNEQSSRSDAGVFSVWVYGVTHTLTHADTQTNRIQQINFEQRIISFVKQLVLCVRAVDRYLRWLYIYLCLRMRWSL